jgi:hypothetical protein
MTDFSLAPYYVAYECLPSMVIYDKTPGGPVAVTRKFPFGWAYDSSGTSPLSPTKGGVFAALNETSQWLEIQDLGVSTDGTPRGTAAKLNTLSVVQVNAKVVITSGERSSGFSPIQRPDEILRFEEPVVDGN